MQKTRGAGEGHWIPNVKDKEIGESRQNKPDIMLNLNGRDEEAVDKTSKKANLEKNPRA